MATSRTCLFLGFTSLLFDSLSAAPLEAQSETQSSQGASLLDISTEHSVAPGLGFLSKVQTANAPVSSFLWHSLNLTFGTAPMNSTRLVGNSLEETLRQRSKRWAVVEEWTSNWIIACWRGFSALILLKAACMLSNMIFQISPFPLIKNIISKKDTGDVDAAPLICIAFGCCQWTFYGTFAWWVTGKTGFLVLIYANVVGAVLGIVYVTLYHVNCKSDEWWRQLVLYYRIALTVVMFQVCILWTRPTHQALLLIGAIASCCSLITAVAPLAGLPRVIKTKCSKTIPLPLVLASAVSALLWAVCGIQLADPMITWPNIIAIAANTILLAVAAVYPQEEKIISESECQAMDKLEKECFYNVTKDEGSNVNFNTFSHKAAPILCSGGWKEGAIIVDSSGGTF